ncbi:MAG TPA: CoA-binding protein [Bacteroidales bacterium]|nr:CoA-binding protein [Bacteroidales bacterium]
MQKTTLILGASPNPDRYSYKAVQSLHRRGINVIAVGLRNAEIGGIQIIKGKPEDLPPVHTIGLYLGPKNQSDYYDYIISLQPQRIIFNPGTWNPELAKLAQDAEIEVIEDCMLAMLNCGNY